MRAIVNMMSPTIAKAAGWRAREVKIDKSGVTVEEIFRAVKLSSGAADLYELVAEEQGLKPTYALYVGGELLRGAFDWQRPIVDSEQIHVADWPMTDF